MKNYQRKIIGFEEQKKIALEILKFLVQFCVQNNLRIYLAYGSLIGAIRHKGFIPWDDDIDVWMPREDYNKLLEIFPEHPYYKLYHHGNLPTYSKIFATLNDIRTFKEEFMIRRKFRKELCINVDIFPIDNIPDDEKKKREYIEKSEFLKKELQCLVWKYSKGSTFKNGILKNTGIFLMRSLETFAILSLPVFLKKITDHLVSYNTDITKFCTTNGLDRQYAWDDFKSAISVEFEGELFPAPIGYDHLLTNEYGDYMKLPPEDKRHPHHLCHCYWR